MTDWLRPVAKVNSPPPLINSFIFAYLIIALIERKTHLLYIVAIVQISFAALDLVVHRDESLFCIGHIPQVFGIGSHYAVTYIFGS